MTKATISSKGQITIPKSIRERMQLRAGMQVGLEVEGDGIVLKRLGAGLPHWSTMRGMFRDAGDFGSELQQERASELLRDDERLKWL